MQNFLQNRIERIATGILENEAITSSLDDDAADIFLKWALARAKTITHATLEIANEEEADEAMYSRLKSIRRMGKSLGRWQASEDPMAALQKIMGYVATIYGDGFQMPDEATLQQFVAMYQGGEPGLLVSALVELLEPTPVTEEEKEIEIKIEKKTGRFGRLFSNKKD